MSAIVPPERRLFEAPMQLRDTQLVGKPYKYLEGRAVPYDEWAQVSYFFLEKHELGSLDQTTKVGSGKGLPLLLFHDNRSFLIGVNEVLGPPGRRAARGVRRLNDFAEAQQAARLADDGSLGYMSIGFQPIRSNWEYVDDFNPDLGPDHIDRVTRQESRLLEVSLTPTPAFAGAEITLVRTAERPRQQGETRADGWRRELARLRHDQ